MKCPRPGIAAHHFMAVNSRSLGILSAWKAPARHTPRGRNGEVGSGLRVVGYSPAILAAVFALLPLGTRLERLSRNRLNTRHTEGIGRSRLATRRLTETVSFLASPRGGFAFPARSSHPGFPPHPEMAVKSPSSGDLSKPWKPPTSLVVWNGLGWLRAVLLWGVLPSG